MSTRAKRIAIDYLKKAQTPETSEGLSDKEITDSVSEALERLYVTYIQQKLKSLDVNVRFPALSRLVRHFGNSSEQAFYDDLNQLMNRFYRIVKDSALEMNSSLRKKIFDEIKKQKITDTNLIEDYIRSEFKHYMIDTERQTKIFINKPLQ